MAGGLSLGQERNIASNNNPPRVETSRVEDILNVSELRSATESGQEQGRVVAGTRSSCSRNKVELQQEQGRVAAVKYDLEGQRNKGPEQQTKDGKDEKQVKGNRPQL
jgi:hypothetical protein